MMYRKSPSLSFFVAAIALIIIESVYCSSSDNGEKQFFDTSQPTSSLEEKLVLNALINGTNSSVLPHVRYNVTVLNKNESSFKVLDDFERELLVATTETRGKVCLKNVKRCMQEGKSRLSVYFSCITLVLFII